MEEGDLRVLLIHLLLPLCSLMKPGLQMQKLGAEHCPFSHPSGQWATHLEENIFTVTAKFVM